MSEWQEFILEDAVERFIDYRGKTPPKTDSGIPLVTAKIVKNGAIQTPSEFISEETYDQWMTRGFPKENDVVLTTEAPLGEVALLKDENVALAQRIILMRGKPHVLNNGFLKYYFQSREGQHLLQSRASGTTVFGIKAAVLKKIPIPVPPLPEQKAISAVLSSLDDKIDLLHRQNKTLEALAQTLFRHWFIDGAEDDWEECVITDLFEIRDGTHDSPKQSAVGKPLITSRHIKDFRLDFDNAYLISEEDFVQVNKRSCVNQFDILFSMIGTIGLIYLEQSETVEYAIKNVGLFKTSQNPDWAFFTYLWLKSSYGKEFIFETRSGSTQQYIPLGSLRSIVYLRPPEGVLADFNASIRPLFAKIRINQKQIGTLEKLRDTLLPKLMSGEVRVRHQN